MALLNTAPEPLARFFHGDGFPARVARPLLISTTRRALIGSLLTGVSGQGALIVSGVLAARILGVENRGHLALLVLIPTGLSQLGGLGLPMAVTYFIARDEAHAAAIVRSLLKPALAQVALIVAVHILILGVLLDDEPQVVRLAGVVTLAWVPSALALQYGLAILQGQQRFRSFNILRLLPASLYSVGVLFIFLLPAGSLPWIASIWVASYAVVGTTTLVISIRCLPSAVDGPTPTRWQMLRFGLRGFLGSVSPIENFRVDQALVSFLLSPAALGLYIVGVSFTSLPRFLAQSVGMVAYPRVASLFDPTAARRSIWRFFGVTFLICGAVVAVLEVSVGWLLPFFFGEQFSEAVPIARILLLSSVFFGARRVLVDGARGVGQVALGTVGEAVSLVFLLIALWLLMPRLGVEGVALALVLSSAASLTVITSMVVRRPVTQPKGLNAPNYNEGRRSLGHPGAS